MTKDYPVQAYLPPLYNRMILGLSKYTGSSKSKIATKAIEKYFDDMHPQEREKILSLEKTIKQL
jgi:predicted DNA-binding protein